MLPCTCGIDRDGYIIWDPYCPRHGNIKAEEKEEDKKWTLMKSKEK